MNGTEHGPHPIGPTGPGPGRGVPSRAKIGRMSFDPYEPYGTVVATTMRIVTWNVWGRYGDWERRQAGIARVLAAVDPDVICLVEAWSAQESTQPHVLAGHLGREHDLYTGSWEADGWTSGLGMVSRWPVTDSQHCILDAPDGGNAGGALFAALDGPRGPVQIFVVALDYPLDASAARQGQVRQLGEFIGQVARRRHPTVVCGDFNAAPDAEEMRMLMGKTVTAAPGLVFYDAWEIAGGGGPGFTWSNDNPLAALALYPDRRFDYVLSAWPRLGGVGHPVHCELLGAVPHDQPQLSDHYGVLADLRY